MIHETVIHRSKNTTKIREMYIRSYAYRNPKTLEIGSGTKFLFTFLSLRFSDMRERDTQFLSMLTFPSDPTTNGPHRKLLVWPRRAPKIDLFRPSPNLNTLFFVCFYFKFQNPPLIASGHGVIHVPGHIFYLGFLLTSLIVTSAPHAREHLHSMCAPN